MSVYDECVLATPGNRTAVMNCVADSFEQRSRTRDTDVTGVASGCGCLVGFHYADWLCHAVRRMRSQKNVQNTMIKNMIDACSAAVAFYAVGFAFAFGGQDSRSDITFIGTANFFASDVSLAFWFFEYTFAAVAVTIVAGALAERCQMMAYAAYSVFQSAFVYPVAAHAIWSSNGFLSATAADPLGGIGSIDFSGSGVIHLVGGTTSLIAVVLLGPRKGRFVDRNGRPLREPKKIPGHSEALQLLGTFVLWFGWYGFNPSSALLLPKAADRAAVGALAAINTSVSAAAGAISGLFTNLYLEERKSGEFCFSLTTTMNGLLSGLVAITAPCGTVEPWAACVIGLVAGWFYIIGSAQLLRWKIDDVCDVIPVHMINGAWGVLATGLFSSPSKVQAAFGTSDHVGWFYSMGHGSTDATLLRNQVFAIGFHLTWTTIMMLPFFSFLNYMGWLRTDSVEELVGLDRSYMGGTNEESGMTPGTEALEALLQQKKRSSLKRTTAPREVDDSNDDSGVSWSELSADVAAEVKQKKRNATSSVTGSAGSRRDRRDAKPVVG